jgi:lipoate-protein ligase A
VAFGKLDAIRPGYEAAREAARAHGFAPLLRAPGGHAAAYHDESLGIDVVHAAPDAIPHVHDWFRDAAETLADALSSLGVDARVGAVPGEYCPGAYSVNARGRVKLVGTAQRVVRGASLLGATIVVRDGARVRAVLADVYRALELEWDDATAGAVEGGREIPRALARPVAGRTAGRGDVMRARR